MVVTCFHYYGYSQDLQVYNHFYIQLDDGHAEIQCLSTKKPEIEPGVNTIYYWSDRKKIHSTQGGFSWYLLHGPFVQYNSTGGLMEKGSFIEGVKNGRWTIWQENGKLLEDCQYVDGNLNGILVHYDIRGKVIKTAEYKNGELHGNLIIYQSDTVYSKKTYRKDELVKIDGKPLPEKESIPEKID
jgi:hypothetical protein